MLAGSPQYRVLGPLQVLVEGREVPVSAAKQRILLAALLLKANTPVTADELIERLWGDNPPTGARDTVRAYVMRLRNLLGGRDTIVTAPSGYVIRVEPRQLDLLHVRELIADPSRLHEAWALWRGPALADVPSDSLRQSDGPALEELRLHVLTCRIDQDLTHGRHAEVVAELSTAASEYPLHEGLTRQLMLALHLSGRSAEALDHYERLRRRLADELGTDPSPELRDLHRQLLIGEPTVPPLARIPVPRQLPAMPRGFTGRLKELAELDRGGAIVISAIGGTGGIGKSWLALHWAHRNLARFPDGQLYVNLRGFAPLGAPLDPAVAVRGFLDALGVEPAAMPGDFESQVGLYRSLVADRRLLVVLDNARDTTQVEALLPGGGACTTLVTSRHQLGGLVVNHAAMLLTLGVLEDAEAYGLLVDRIGERRIAAEPDAVREMVARCGGLPLALGIVAARVAMEPTMPLAVLADELRKTASVLDALDAGELTASLRTVFACSYDALDADTAKVFRLLGLAPGPDISLTAVVNLTGFGTEQLARLEEAHLVQQHVPGRYRMHDLVRIYAAEQAAGEEAALARLVDHYLHTSYAGNRMLDPLRQPLELDDPFDGHVPFPLANEAAALAWFEAEHACLLAAQQAASDGGWLTAAWQLAWALTSFHWRRALHRADVLAWRQGLAAAEQLGDPEVLATVHRFLGRAYNRVGETKAGLEQLEHSLNCSASTGDVFGTADTHFALAVACQQQDDYQQVLAHAYAALRIYQEHAKPVGEARMLNAVGWFHAQIGEHDKARPLCEQGLRMFQRLGDRDGEATVLDSLGYIAQQSGDHAAAVDYLRQALVVFAELGHAASEADTHLTLGKAHCALGQHHEAQASWQRALDLYSAQNRTDEADVVRKLMDSADDDRR